MSPADQLRLIATPGHTLPDGSMVRVEPIGTDGKASLISRVVDGEVLWGQAFSSWNPASHDAQVTGVLVDMAQHPQDFECWWFATRPRLHEPRPA